ncbi:hypothetical protein L1049_019332 [Liquidambar formosana]|uniref:GYF domain-containing protein n=1 Tax=Liquidambar formosana TaxID=63359 RepID=A0AAP0X578_LIQFO
MGTSEIPAYDVAANGTAPTWISNSTDAAGLKDAIITSKVIICDSSVGGEGNGDFINGVTSGKEVKGIGPAFWMPKVDSKMGDAPAFSVKEQKTPAIEIRDESNGDMQLVNLENMGFQRMLDKQLMAAPVIDLSDDEENQGPSGGNQIVDDQLKRLIWYYLDPQGDVQGPFSMNSLKRWSDCDYFPADFKVWKTSQRPDEAISLSDMLSRMFPN